MKLFQARLTTSLLCLGALAFGLYSFFDASNLSTEQKSSRLDHVFISFPFDELLSIRFSDSDRALQLKREGEQFYVLGSNLKPSSREQTETAEFPADPVPLRQLKTTLSQLSWRRRLQVAPPLSQLGLQKPRVTIELTTEDGRFVLSLGSKSNAPPDTIYAQLETEGIDTTVGVVDSDLLNDLSLDPQRFAGRRLLNIGKKHTRSLSIKTPAQHFTLESDLTGFHFKEQGQKVDRELSDLLFLQLARTSVDSFIEPEQVNESLFADSIEVRQIADDGAEESLRFGKACPHNPSLIAIELRGARNLVGCASNLALGIINLPKARYIDRSVASLRPDEVDRVEVSEGSDVFDLIRKQDAFEILRPKIGPLNLLDGNQYLKALLTTQGTLLSSKDPRQATWDKTPALGTIRLKSPVHPKTILIEIIERALDGSLILRRAGGDYLKFSSNSTWQLSAQAMWARSKVVFETKPSEIDQIQIKSKQLEETIIYQSPLRFAAPYDDIKVDSSLADDLRRSVAQIEAQRWLASAAQPQAGFNDEFISVMIMTKSAEHRLLIGQALPGGHWAQFDSDGAPFVISGPLLELLQLSHADRSAAKLELNRAKTLKVSGGNSSLVFESNSGGLSIMNGQVYPEQAQGLLDLCQTLAPLYRLSAPPVNLGLERFRIETEGKTLIFFAPTLVRGRVVAPVYLPQQNLYFHFGESPVAEIARLL